MLYTPPDQWTEKQLLSLSGEDDRYEFKSGGILYEEKTQKPKADEVLCNELAVEICAFANSFGGTLFLGVKNNKKIDGVPKFYKGKQSNPFIEWLEKKVAHLLEFRLPNYRVTEVIELTEETAQLLGDDKVIIAIDIFDSDLAPHQCKHNNKYYYRQSSNSNPAPHHYLAYLWSRTSNTQAGVVKQWCLNFLNDVIVKIQITERELGQKEFKTGRFLYDSILMRGIQNLTADQFLRTFPKIAAQLEEFEQKAYRLREQNYQTLQRCISESKVFEKSLRNFYSKLTDDSTEDVDFLKVVEGIAKQFKTAYNGTNALDAIIKLTACAVLDSQEPYNSGYEREFWEGFIPLIVSELKNDEIIQNFANQTKSLMQEFQEFSDSLAMELSDFRYQLCLKHNTSYY